MRNRTLSASLAVVGLLLATPAQDLLHYKFDGGCGSTEINYAAGSPAPAQGTIAANLAGGLRASWTTGRFGLALAPGAEQGLTFNYVNTGWAPFTLTGAFSWACWLRVAPNTTLPALSGLFGDVTGGCFLANSQLLTMGWAGPSTFNAGNLLARARAGWTHVACVFDSAARRVTYYLDGTPQAPGLVNGTLAWAGGNVTIGRYNGMLNTAFAIDEFILANRLMSAAEIAGLATDPRAADGAFGPSAGPTLAGNGQRPLPGNQGYGFVLNANVGAGLLVFGSNRCTMAGGTIPLPADLGLLSPSLAGMQVYVDSDLGGIWMGFASGPTPVPFPLPNLPGLSGFSFHGQALTFDGSSNRYLHSNAMTIGIGR